MDPAVFILVPFVVLFVVFRWPLALRRGLAFWANRPRVGRAAYNARVAAAKAEEADAAACLAALTREDVDYLTNLGWAAPAHLRRPLPGVEVMTKAGPVTLGVRAATPAELRFDPYADGTLKRPMSLVSRDGFV